MLKKLLFISFVISLCGAFRLNAQCIDSSMVQPGAYCDPQWIPVCGCDGITYRNDCFSRINGLTSWNYGICDAVDFDFNPNPPTDYINVNAIIKLPGFMQVQLIDRFGRIFYSTSYNNPGQMSFQIDVNGFPVGLYYLTIWCNDGFKVRKVLIADLQ